MFCRCEPPPKLQWYKNDTEIPQGGRYTISYLADGIAKLTISSPSQGDSGRYTCKAESGDWFDQVSYDFEFTSKEDHVRRKLKERAVKRATPSLPTSSSSSLTLAPSSLTSRRPYFSGVLTDASVPSGGVMALQVQVKGTPAEVSWFKDSQKLASSARHRTHVERGVHTLMIPNVNELESGKYTCRAANVYGRIETSAYVRVVHPGQIRDGKPAMFLSRPDKYLRVTEGEDINVSFRVTGDPKPRSE